jgi:hypothetical protein
VAITGTATVVDREVPVDVTLGDILSMLKLAGELRFEAWNGPLGIVLQGAFANLDDSKSRADLTFDLKSRTYVGQAAGAVRLGRLHPGQGQPSLAFDLIGGVQVTRVSETLDLDMRSRTTSATVAKAISEARAILRLSPEWAIVARGLMSVPDLSYGGGGAVEYDFSRYAIRLGYSYTKLNYSSTAHRLKLDLSMHGPYVGFGIRFGTGPIF